MAIRLYSSRDKGIYLCGGTSSWSPFPHIESCPDLGVLLSSVPSNKVIYDQLNIEFTVPTLVNSIADGSCGIITSVVDNYQYLPAGFCTEYPGLHTNEVDPTYSYVSAADGNSYFAWWYYGQFEDGTGISHKDWTCDRGFKLAYGCQMSNSFPYCRDGNWENDTDAYIIADGNCGFELNVYSVAVEPPPPPPPCPDAGTVSNFISGHSEQIYLPDGNWYNSGYQNDYYEYNDGNCSYYTEGGDYVWRPYGEFIVYYNDYNYYHNGNGSYYQESTVNQCPPAGSGGSSGSGDYNVYVGEIGHDVVVGYYSYGCTADGNCGEYCSGMGYYAGYGTIVAQENGYIIYSNGNGGYWSEYPGNACDSAGNMVGTGSAVTYVNINGSDYQTGYYDYQIYTDGNCGYVETNQSYFYYPYETPIFGDENGQYFHDGSGYYFYRSN